MVSFYRANSRHATEGRKTQQLKWACWEQQYLFNYGPFPICASGGFGAGKTIGFARKLLALMDWFPGYRCVIARSHFEDLKNTTRPSFFKICPPEAYEFGRRADSDKSLKLNPVRCEDGVIRQSELLWMHFDDPAIAEVIKGLEINAFLLDQAEDMQEDVFEKLLARLGRWDDVYVPTWVREFRRQHYGGEWPWVSEETGQPVPPSYAMMTVNPEDELHWIYRRFHPDSEDHHALREREDGSLTSYESQGYKMVFMDSTNNIFLNSANKRQMLDNDPTFVRRYVRGQWGIPEGVIHNVPKQSIVPYSPEVLEYIYRTCRLHRVLDHGDAAPTCCTWWGSDREGNIICFREYYKPNDLISNHRIKIFELSHHDVKRPDGHVESVLERYDWELADPAIFIKTMQKYGGRWSVADEYSDVMNLPEENAVFWQPADNNEMATRNRVNEYLKVDPDHVNPFTKQRGAPRIYFIEHCLAYPHGAKMAIRETRSQRREQIGSNMGKPVFSDDRDKSVSDHAYDTVRYIVGSRPAKAETPGRERDPRSFAAVREEMIKARRRQRGR